MHTVTTMLSSKQLPWLIGNTPLIQLSFNEEPEKPLVEIWGKCEFLNRYSTSKTRPAYYMLRKAKNSGEITKGKIAVVPSSGNTAFAIAALAAEEKIQVMLVLPKNVGLGMLATMSSFGARLLLTDAGMGSDGAYNAAVDLCEREPEKFFLIDQYSDTANVQAHIETTGPEIWEQTNGKITDLVAPIGTGGTISGSAIYLKQMNPKLRVFAVGQMEEDPIPGLRNYFSRQTVPAIFDPWVVDEYFHFFGSEAWSCARICAKLTGLAIGPSAGAAIKAAKLVGNRIDNGLVVTILPDSAEKYWGRLNTNQDHKKVNNYELE